MHTAHTREVSMLGAIETMINTMATKGIHLTPDQRKDVRARLGAAWDRILATPVDSITAAVQVSAAVALVIGELAGLVPPDGFVARQINLMAVGYEAQHLHLQNGGYPAPTPEQLARMTRAVRLGAEQLAPFGDALTDAEVRVLMTEHTARAVVEVLGAPRARSQMN